MHSWKKAVAAAVLSTVLTTSIAVSPAIAATSAGTEAQAQASTNASASQPAKVGAASRVDPKSLGSITPPTSTPWRAEQAKDGKIKYSFGPGVASSPLDSDTVKFAEGGGADASRSAKESSGGVTTMGNYTGDKWKCYWYNMPQPEQTGAYLKSYIGTYCVGGRPGTMRLEWWFDRSAVWTSFSGWAQYTNSHSFTSWTSDQSQGTDIYTYCNKRDGSKYGYRARGNAQVLTGGATITWDTESPGVTYNCGKKVS